MKKCTLPYCERKCLHNKAKGNFVKLLSKYGQILASPKNTFGSVWLKDEVFHLYYTDFHNMYLAISCDGFHWQTDKKPLLLGDVNGWDKGIDCVTVFNENDIWRCLYRGHSCWGKLPSHSIGLANSLDGQNWLKSGYNPVIIPDTKQWDGEYLAKNKPVLLDPWGIIKVGNVYHLWFNSDTPERCRCTGLATSVDLINWEKDKNNPIFTGGKFCVSPFKYKDFYYLIVTANGFQRKTNFFELYRDKKPTFYKKDRKYIGRILDCGEKGSFDEGYVDTPSLLTNDICRDSFPNIKTGYLYYTGESSNVGQWTHGLATFDFEDLEKL